MPRFLVTIEGQEPMILTANSPYMAAWKAFMALPLRLAIDGPIPARILVKLHGRDQQWSYAIQRRSHDGPAHTRLLLTTRYHDHDWSEEDDPP